MFLIMVIAGFGTWLIARNVVLALFADDRPAAALHFWPASGRALAAVALEQTVAADGVVGSQARALLQDALRRSPLLSEPLALAGLDASARDQTEQARALMEEARRRDPRAVIPRSWLLDYYLARGLYGAGLDEAGRLMIIEPEAQPGIMAMLTALLALPQARPALVAKLRGNPWWRVRFFEQASASPSLVPPMASLLLAAPNTANPADRVRELQALLQGVAAEGRYRLAYDIWQAQLPPRFRKQTALIYDGNFQGWPGIRPFNWRLHAIDDGSVKRVDVPDMPGQSALQISSNASQRELAAEQIVLVQSGAYRLSVVSRRLPDADADAARLGLSVSCMPANTSLADLSFDPTPTASARQIDFVAQPSCTAVAVRFFVRPGENPGPLNAQISAVNMMRLRDSKIDSQVANR